MVKIDMMKHLFGIILLMSLFMAGSQAQDENPLWNLGTSDDWLSRSVYRYTPYHFSDYHPPTGNDSGFVKFFTQDYIYTPYYLPYYTQPNYNRTYYTPPYWAYPFPGSPAWIKYQSRPWWIGSHEDLTKTMEIARSSSSLRVFAGGAWTPP